MLCDDYKNLHPKLITCAVKGGLGNMTMNYSTEDTLKSIRELTQKALSQDLKDALVKLPKSFEAEIYFKEHHQAEKASYFPGVTKKSDNIITYSSDCFFEILRTTGWVMR